MITFYGDTIEESLTLQIKQKTKHLMKATNKQTK